MVEVYAGPRHRYLRPAASESRYLLVCMGGHMDGWDIQDMKGRGEGQGGRI